ncbi:MAG: gliding motility-associated C-terminal domain-containing protein [Chitinophagaceae bacterium]|nr:gliding motility-associated C-terminal domain-containing protein [Chitinophagaceae bacterium]
MKTKLIALIGLMLFCRLPAFSQGQNNIWTMGVGLGLDFNTPGPVLYPNSIKSREGCASVCDYAGNLLFYCDGNRVFDRTHTVMPNGSGLLGDVSTTQGVAIAKIKGTDSLYYLFTLSLEGAPGNLYYSVIDLRLNGGLGDVDMPNKNIFIQTYLSEKMIIAGDCRQQWLLLHDRERPRFYAYGLGSGTKRLPLPVTSFVGAARVDKWIYMFGELKIAPDQKTLAMATSHSEGVELFDFDNSTGLVSNYRLLDTNLKRAQAYGLEFSPDNTKLYAGSLAGPHNGLYQYDLSAGSPALITASRHTLYSGYVSGMRLGPDQKVYVILYGIPQNFSRINAPNLKGALCNFEKDFLPSSFANTEICLGFGNKFVLPTDTIRSTSIESICSDDLLRLSGSGYKAYYWDDGSRDSVKLIPGTSGVFTLHSVSGCDVRVDRFEVAAHPRKFEVTKRERVLCTPEFMSLSARPGADSVRWSDGSRSPELTVAAAGKYWVTSYNICSIGIDTFVVRSKPLAKDLVIKDTNVCFRDSVRLSAPIGFTSFAWSGGSVQKDTIVRSPGKFIVVARHDTACSAVSFVYNLSLQKPIYALKDTTSCSQDSLTLDARVEDMDATYEWSTGERTPRIRVAPPATRFILVRTGHCTLLDTIEVAHLPSGLDLGPDQIVCQGERITLRSNISGYQYLWSTGASAAAIEVSESGTYVVKAYNDSCSSSARVYVNFVNCVQCAAIPNAFTPNQDGINDLFKPVLNCPVLQYELSVRNRWGQVLFSTESPNEGWDGSSKGLPLEGNVYYYLLKVKFMAQEEQEELYKGDVTLIR